MSDSRISAAAAWLMSDDSAYAVSPGNAIRAAQEMLDAADLADEVSIGPRLAAARDRAIRMLTEVPGSQRAAFIDALSSELGLDPDTIEAGADRILADLYVRGYVICAVPAP